MRSLTQEFIDLLNVKQLDSYLFQGQNTQLFGSHLMGGQKPLIVLHTPYMHILFVVVVQIYPFYLKWKIYETAKALPLDK